ncbi:MAG: alpha-amylase, partial [Muribaculaceae bacterium]|nr:alpha-amylase [Muribaculaceae bacterium]
ADSQLWDQLARDARHLAGIGVTAVWIPPAYKGSGINDVGYGVYDLYDFGEFDQKGCVATKYGTRAQLEKAIAALHDNGIQVILDTVLNHRMNGDSPERFMAQPVAADNRMANTGEPREIEAYTSFTFPGRGDTYSPFKWHWYHFSGVDYDNLTGDTDIFRILGDGKGWSQGVDKENGNYDFLMGNDVDVNNPEVADHLIGWSNWVTDTFGFDGFRMDAVKHIDNVFTRRFLEETRRHAGKDLYAVSEYWSDDLAVLTAFIDTLGGSTDLFDVPLHFNFHQAGETGEAYDMSHILDNTLTAADPLHSVTFVDNHDSQQGSSLSSDVQDWFKPLAYSLILLMKEGYPVIFYGDYYSLTHTDPANEGENDEEETVREASPHRRILDILLHARRTYAYGDQTLLLDHPSTIGLIRHGDAEHPGSGLVLLMSNGADGTKQLSLGEAQAGRTWKEITGSIPEKLTLDDAGCGTFSVKGRNLAVWVMDPDSD